MSEYVALKLKFFLLIIFKIRLVYWPHLTLPNLFNLKIRLVYWPHLTLTKSVQFKNRTAFVRLQNRTLDADILWKNKLLIQFWLSALYFMLFFRG